MTILAKILTLEERFHCKSYSWGFIIPFERFYSVPLLHLMHHESLFPLHLVKRDSMHSITLNILQSIAQKIIFILKISILTEEVIKVSNWPL